MGYGAIRRHLRPSLVPPGPLTPGPPVPVTMARHSGIWAWDWLRERSFASSFGRLALTLWLDPAPRSRQGQLLEMALSVEVPGHLDFVPRAVGRKLPRQLIVGQDDLQDLA